MTERRNNHSPDHLRQAGFTLVEISIVLVIIGLLVGAIIKGQGMIRQARMKSVEQLVSDIRTAASVYYRSQGKLPGDTNGDGWIGFNAVAEIDEFFPDLVEQKILTGDPSATVRRHSFDGDVVVEYKSFTGVKGNYINFKNLPQDVMDALDAKYDDGVASTGSVRSDSSNFYLPL